MDAPVSRRWIVPLLLLMLAGCESVGYYTHVAGGQLKLLASRERVDAVLADLDARGENAVLRERLGDSQRMLHFAEQSLDLEVGDRYRSYVALDRPNVVWNVFAAPPLSLEPRSWCYPFVGCAPYRGYFDKERAQAMGARLEEQGLETYLGGVSAYSTLGWFDDPLLSSFISLSEPAFAELIFHELAHSRVWIKGDVTFNESFASFVGFEGMRQWLGGTGKKDLLDEHLSGQRTWRAAKGMLITTRNRLDSVYSGSGNAREKLDAKAVILADARMCLQRYARSSGAPGYQRLMSSLNNAYLASLATYTDALGAFEALFEAENGDWQSFYARVEALAELEDTGRAQALSKLGEQMQPVSSQQQVAADGDNNGADEVQCESFSSHGGDGESLR